jgi:hypothetical protein
MKENLLRRLARSYHSQIVYSRSKEIGGIHLFDNATDLSKIQIIFLQYLELYYNVNVDLMMNEDLISQEVIDDWLRLDSYLLYKRKKAKQDKLKPKNNRDDKKVTDRVVFRHRK